MRDLPSRGGFDITETIGLTRWEKAEKQVEPNRFRRFRTFINVVGLALCVDGNVIDDVLPANYTVIRLIEDAFELADAELLRLLPLAFEEFHAALVARDWEESPFVLLGLLLVKAKLGANEQELSLLADQIIEEERTHAGRASGDFLLGCTFFNQLHRTWKKFVAKFVPASTPSLALLRDAIISQPDRPGRR